ncbi:MAG: hypothetical protein J0L57_17810, partial [Burkholderiales bacterium]|nr:hypothetical protein [Burkholderiales bacterium]
MKRKGWRPQFVNIHGQPWSVVEHGRPDEPASEKAPPKDPAALGLTPADVERVFDALCLAGWQRGKTALQQLLRGLGWRRSDGRGFGGEEVGAALRALVDAGRVHRLPDQGYRLDWAQRRARLPALLAEPAARDAWRVWAWASSGAYGPLEGSTPWANVRQPEEAESLWLLVLGSGMTIEAYNATARKALVYASAADAPFGALAKLVEIGAQGRVDPRLWWALLGSLDQDDGLRRHPALLGWIDAELGRAGAVVPFHLRLRIAERRLHAGRFDAMHQALQSDANCEPYVPVLQAGRAAYEGSWAAAATGFAAALKALGAQLGKRRGLVPRSLQQWQALALIAQPEAAAWTAAHKLCVAESGSRTPSAFDPWGRWAHAVAVRLGDARIEPKVFAAAGGRFHGDPDVEADKLILAAWLDQRPEGWSAAHVQAVADALHADGLPWKADLLAQAAERFGLTPPARPADAPPPWAPRFFAPAQAAWRDALAAIVALGDGRAATAEAPLQTLRWRLALDDEGRVANL